MKKLLSFPAIAVALAFSLITWWGCGGNPGPATNAGSPRNDTAADIVPGNMPKIQDTPVHTVRWRIDSLMRTHFDPAGPGVVLSLERDTGSRAGKVFVPKAVLDSTQTVTWVSGLNQVPKGPPVTSNAVFNIGSLTKQFTAAAIQSLAAAGKLSVMDPVGKYLSGLPKAVAKVSIQQLLSHCSGIPDHYGFTDTSVVKHARDKDVLDAIRKSDTVYFVAGTRYRYSNTAYCLLGMVIEKCSGVNYENYLKKNIFTGGMKESSVLSATSVIGNRVHGYEKDSLGHWKESDAPESVFFTTEADGGLLTSMHDYMSWCKQIENLYSLPVLTGPRTMLNGLLPRTIADSASGLSYGYGWFILQPKTGKHGPLIYHTGFNGGFRTSVLLIPEIHYRIAIFSASPGVDLEELVHQINLILGVDDKGFIKSGPLES